jgi:predicted MFS family arabinose efflux permease
MSDFRSPPSSGEKSQGEKWQREKYRNYVLGVLAFGYLLNALDRSILGILLEPIKLEFGVSDTALGLLGGIAFAAFYSTLGIPIALWADRSNRSSILALAILVWSAMTAFCGLAPTFMLLLLARIGTAIGEAGGSPPSHALISDYFSPQKRGTALAIFALGAPMGATLGSVLGGLGNELFGWRLTFVLAGLPGLLLAPLVWSTVVDPRTAQSTGNAAQQDKEPAPPLREVAGYLWQRRSYIHLCLACALHATAVYGTGAFNASFLIRSHGWNTADIGQLLGFVGVAGILGTFIGGVIADRCSVRWDDPRWYVWVCGLSSLLMAPALLISYLSNSVPLMITAFLAGGFLSAVFFGPSFAATQALAGPRMRAVTSSILIFVKTMLGMGLGPFLIGRASDVLSPTFSQHSLRYALLLAAIFNIWAAWHFFASARHLRKDLTGAAGTHTEPALQPRVA